jgi:hypothetical protein
MDMDKAYAIHTGDQFSAALREILEEKGYEIDRSVVEDVQEVEGGITMGFHGRCKQPIEPEIMQESIKEAYRRVFPDEGDGPDINFDLM